MKSNDVVTRFLKICVGISLVLFSTGIFFFSVKYNAAQAAPKLPIGFQNGVMPFGFEFRQNKVIVYGYDANAFQGSQIKVLAKESPSGRTF